MERSTTRLDAGALRRGSAWLTGRLVAVRPASIALAVGLGIGLFVILGILQRTRYPSWLLANLDSEASAATPFSAALLWAAAITWVLVAIAERPARRLLVGWAGLLALLAFDEGIAFHEALERGTGIDWQVLYLPVLAIAALLWLKVVRIYQPSATATLLIAVAGIWAITLVLELVQHWGGQAAPAAIYDPAMITEEGLEMVGSTLVLMAGLTELRASHPNEEPGYS